MNAVIIDGCMTSSKRKYLKTDHFSYLSEGQILGVFSPTCSRKEHDVVNGLNELELNNTANQERSKQFLGAII